MTQPASATQPSEESHKVLPFYIVLDESGSMAGPSIDAVNSALPDLHATIASDPNVCDKTSVCVITFSDHAQVLVPLTRMDEISQMGGIVANGTTSYTAAFTKLRETIEADVARLKSGPNPVQVLRPACFFISDGVPTDGETWPAAHAALTEESFKARPIIISFGVGDAHAQTIHSVATAYRGARYAFMARQGTNPAAALKEILKSLTNSIVGSSRSSTPALVPPQDVAGVDRIELDTL